MPSRWDHSALANVPPSPPSSQPLLSLPAGPQHQRREERRPEMRDWPLLMHLSSLPLGFQGSLQRTAPQCVSELPSPWVLLLSRAPRPTPSQQRCCICLILSVWLGFCLGDREVLLEKKKARASSFNPDIWGVMSTALESSHATSQQFFDNRGWKHLATLKRNV